MQIAKKPIKILVVDDEPLLSSLLMQSFDAQIMEKEWQFVFASNGVEALKKLQEDPEIGIVLTDINMPQMDGLTFLDKLSGQEGIYRAVVISAYGDMRNIRIAMNRGAADFVTKPIDLLDLEKTLVKIINQYKLLKQNVNLKQQNIELQRELHISSQIQRSFIPINFNLFDEKIELYGEMIPAKEVGGDFFDLIKIDDSHLMLAVGDVSGKGIPAAIFMAVSQTLLHAVALNTPTLGECISKIDDLLSANNESMMFVTVFCALLNVDTGELQYCNAGHVPSYIMDQEGNIQQLGRYEGTAIGINTLRKPEKRHSVFKVHTAQLKPQDTLILYTDGVTEAVNESLQFYSEEHFINFLKTKIHESPIELAQSIKGDLKGFVQEKAQADDITLLIARYLGTKS